MAGFRGHHKVDREFRVQKALAGTGFPVAEMLCFEGDEEVLGRAFYVMSFVPGRILNDEKLPGWTIKVTFRKVWLRAQLADT